MSEMEEDWFILYGTLDVRCDECNTMANVANQLASIKHARDELLKFYREHKNCRKINKKFLKT